MLLMAAGQILRKKSPSEGDDILPMPDAEDRSRDVTREAPRPSPTPSLTQQRPLRAKDLPKPVYRPPSAEPAPPAGSSRPAATNIPRAVPVRPPPAAPPNRRRPATTTSAPPPPIRPIQPPRPFVAQPQAPPPPEPSRREEAPPQRVLVGLTRQVGPAVRPRPRRTARSLLRELDARNLREAVVLMEILQPPVALRDQPPGHGG